MDRLQQIKDRVYEMLELPLEDRVALPHKEYMKLTTEFLALSKEWGEILKKEKK